MKPVERKEILDFVTYTERRDAIRAQIFAHKEPRRIHVGEHLTFLFETRDTVRYQVQEMVRVEQIVREQDIQHELDTYNELLGGPGELGCTLLIEIEEEAERDIKLREWLGLNEHLYLELEDGRRVRPSYDPRQIGEDRLSSVQYMKFDTGGATPRALGADHPSYSAEAPLDEAQKRALAADLSGG